MQRPRRALNLPTDNFEFLSVNGISQSDSSST
jgi:hypothetical protein